MRPRPPRIEPGPGQESVWDYPRPPRVERSDRPVRVVHAGVVIAETVAAWRVLETSQAPGWYLPPADVAMEHLRPAAGRSFCEWKGLASYWDVVVGSSVVEQAAWSYPHPTEAFSAIRDHLAFYPDRVDLCEVDGQPVRAMEGGFYGGWITPEVVGPFQGRPRHPGLVRIERGPAPSWPACRSCPTRAPRQGSTPSPSAWPRRSPLACG